MNQQCPGLILYTTVSVCNCYYHSFRTLNVVFLVFSGGKFKAKEKDPNAPEDHKTSEDLEAGSKS